MLETIFVIFCVNIDHFDVNPYFFEMFRDLFVQLIISAALKHLKIVEFLVFSESAPWLSRYCITHISCVNDSFQLSCREKSF